MLKLQSTDNEQPKDRSPKNSNLKIAGFYGDRAVFQYGKTTILKGTTLPDKKVELYIGDRHFAIFSNQFGEFTFKIPPMKPASGLQMTVICGNEKVIFEDIAFGNVYIAGGQSNMEMPMKEASPDASSLDESILDLIRIFPIPIHTYYGTASSMEGCWIKATKEILNNFSAVGGFFAAALAGKTKIPVGIIRAACGGANIEAFVSEYSLRNSNAYAQEIEQYEDNVASFDLDYTTFPNRNGEKLNKALRTLFPAEPDDGGINAGFCNAGFDDSKWDTMLLPDSWTQAGHNHAGIFYYRRIINLPEGASKHRFTLHLGAVDKSDRTFINGMEIGSTGDIYTMAYWNSLRVYDVPENLLHDGDNSLAVRILSLFSVCTDGGMTGPAEEMYLESEDGSIRVDLSGYWKFKETFDAGTEGMTCMHRLGQGDNNSFHGFFDNMIRPMEGTALAGVIWYQGEANAICTSSIYKELLELMIADWRRNFLDSKLHFYIIQLPDFQNIHRFTPYGTWPLLREAQRMAAENTGSTLINTIGFGDIQELHPRNKKAVAETIADYEYARFCGNNVKIPRLKKISAQNNALLLQFDQKLDKNSPADAFVIAGEDLIAYQANVRFLAHDTIELTANAIEKPFAVWYAWAENPRGFGLRSLSGIVVPPFRAALDDSLPIGKNLID